MGSVGNASSVRREGNTRLLNWSSRIPRPSTSPALLALAHSDAHVILTKMGGGVWERPKAGPWQEISAGLPDRHAMPLVALPGGGTTVLYAGTMGDGAYVKQGDADWRPFGRGLGGVDGTILALRRPSYIT